MEEAEASRNEISKSFEATTRLLNDLETAEKDLRGLDKLHSNMDGLVRSLSSATFDIHGDLGDILASFSKGHVTVNMLEDMVRTEHARSLTLTKMTGAMKLQLEEVFRKIEEVVDAKEAELKGAETEEETADAKETIKYVERQINSIYSDFNDVMQTVDSLDMMVKAPATKVGDAIDQAHHLIESTLQNSPIAKARRLSEQTSPKYTFAPRLSSSPATSSQAAAVLNSVAMGDSIDVDSSEQRLSSDVPGSPTVTIADIEESFNAENSILERAKSGGSMTPIRIKTAIERSCQTSMPEMTSVGTMADALDTADPPADPLDSLVVKGSRAPLSVKELQRAKIMIKEKQAELDNRQVKMLEQQMLLDARANELRRVAHKVVAHEREAQQQMKEVDKIVEMKIAERMAQMHNLSLEERMKFANSSPAAEGKEAAHADKNETQMTQEFLDDEIKNAQAAYHDDSGMGVIEHSISAPPVRDMAPLRVEGEPMGNLSVKSDQESYTSWNMPSAEASRQYDPSSPHNTIPGTTLAVQPVPNLESNSIAENSLGMGSFFDIQAKDVAAVSSPVVVPPPVIKNALPDMMVIFPAKMLDKATTTDDLLFEGNKNKSSVTNASGANIDDSIKSSKIIITGRRGQQPKKTKEPMSDMNISDEPFDDSMITESDHNPNLRRDLPTIASKDGFTTRTYNHPAPVNFKKILSASENPLLTLYEEYKDCLSDVMHSQLLDAAAGKSSLKAANTFRSLFTSILPDIRKLDNSSSIVLKELTLCEDMASNLIVVMGSGEIPDELYFRSLDHMYQKFGEIEALKLWNDVQIGQYRAIFERVNSMNIKMIPSMVRQSEAFEQAYETFVSCTGRTVEAQSRFTALKNRCKRYNIGRGRDDGAGDGIQNNMVPREAYLELADEVDHLRQELAEAEEEAEELNLEVFRVMQEGDRTPGALLFFAALHDPVTTNVMQQVILQLKAIKGFAAGTEHLDFGQLRKRLQVCISCVPNIERFVQRYGALHKKWVSNRLGLFTSKGQVGGGSDSVNLCPMCSNDPASFTPAGGLVNRKSQKDAKEARRKIQDEAIHAQQLQMERMQKNKPHQMKANIKQVQYDHRSVNMSDSIASGASSRTEPSLPPL